jgi:hypothetical protein
MALYRGIHQQLIAFKNPLYIVCYASSPADVKAVVAETAFGKTLCPVRNINVDCITK